MANEDPQVPTLSDRPREPRQRWRVCFSRDAVGARMTMRGTIEAWQDGLAESDLPLLFGEGANPRPKLSIAAPLPIGVVAERELADVWLVERLPVARVRSALAASMPAGHRLEGLWDVWLGEPALAGRVVAAEQRVRVALGQPDTEGLAVAAERLLAAATLPRERAKGDRLVRYDLRPLVAGVEVLSSGAGDDRAVATLRIRTVIDPERGTGRPEEVVAALASIADTPLEATEIVRERLLLSEDV